MTVVISGDTGISPVTASGTSASVDGMTVGRGGGEVSTNTAVGASALTATNTGGYNTAIGNGALTATTAGGNVGVGYNALTTNSTGLNNTAIGTQALNTNSSGAYNTSIGLQSLYSNTTASNNTAVGYQAGYTNATGARNTFIGYLAGYTSAVVSANAYNTFVGAGAGQYTTTGAQNTFIGDTAGQSTTGGLNTFIGQGSGFAITTGTKNSILGMFPGNQGGLDIRTASNYIVLSDGDGNPRLFMNGSGWLYSPPTYALSSAAGTNVGIDGTGLFYRSTSALKYKQNIRDLESIDINKFRPVRYKSKAESDDQTKDHFGIVADEVDAAGITELVTYGIDGEVEGFQYDRLTVVLLKAIQELKTIVDAQAAEIAELKAKVI